MQGVSMVVCRQAAQALLTRRVTQPLCLLRHASLGSNARLAASFTAPRHNGQAQPRRWCCHASADQQDEGPIFAQIDPTSERGIGGVSEQVFGPAAAALIGFQQNELDSFRQAMLDLEADFVKIITCGRKQLDGTLQEALEGPAQPFEQPALGTNRAVILSGLYSSEVLQVIAAYRELGLPEPVWAAAVPLNYTKRVRDLVDSIYGDHRLMKEREREALQAALAKQQAGDPS